MFAFVRLSNLKLTFTIHHSQARFSDNRLQPVQLTTPNLLTNTGSKVVMFAVQSGLYFPRTLRVSGDTVGGVCIYVKKRPQGSDKQETGRTFRWVACGSEAKQMRSLLIDLGGKREGVELDCGCRGCWRAFCSSDVIFGCITEPLPPPSLPVLGILGSIHSGCTASLTWDAAILQCYYERFGRKGAIHHLIEPGPAALILEKVRKRLGSIRAWPSDAKDMSHDNMESTT